MNKKKILKTIGIILISGLLLQTGIIAYANVFGGGNGDIDTSGVVISQEVLDLIQAQDPENFDGNIKNYKEMIVVLDVHNTFKEEIEQLIMQGKQLTDLLVAFVFLNDAYGVVADIEILVNEKELGESWADIFTWYNSENPAFVPRSFDFDYLEQLAKTEGITADDVMIADRVSQKSGTPFEDVIAEKISGNTWKDINASFGILNSSDALPRVPVTAEQLKAYTAGGLLTEDKVVQTLVTVHKLGLDEEDAIDKAKQGYTVEMLFAEVLEEKYY